MEKRLDVSFKAVESGDGIDAHACEACENSDEPIAKIGKGVYICAACMKGALGLLRGLGLTA